MKRRNTPGDPRTVSGQSDIAVALRYDGENAPRVTAKGNDLVAEEMMRIAEAHDVPLYPNPELATALVQIPLGEEVPEELYRAVAEVISFAYLVAGKMPKGFTPPGE
jgi:flagellar biosynthesis protein